MNEMYIVIKAGPSTPRSKKITSSSNRRPRHSSPPPPKSSSPKAPSLKSYATPKGVKNKESIKEVNPKAEVEQGRKLIERDDKKKHPGDKGTVTNVEAIKEAMHAAGKRKKG